MQQENRMESTGVKLVIQRSKRDEHTTTLLQKSIPMQQRIQKFKQVWKWNRTENLYQYSCKNTWYRSGVTPVSICKWCGEIPKTRKTSYFRAFKYAFLQAIA